LWVGGLSQHALTQENKTKEFYYFHYELLF